MMDRKGGAKTDIDKFTQLGASELQNGHLEKAQEYFELAWKRAQHVQDGYSERACAFNLGAVYIALRKAQHGLEVLQKAIPPVNHKDGKSNGDLFYNIGLGYELLQNIAEAVKYFELALEEYQMEHDNIIMEAEVANKLGSLYVRLTSYLQAARAFALAASAYGKVHHHEDHAQCLCHQACALQRGYRTIEAQQIADDCMIICQRVLQEHILGKLYNDLGLLYTQCGDYSKAAASFELALPLNRGPKGDRRREAVILQNLGAIYNSLGDYQRSLSFHEASAGLHAELGNRNAQGQCFANLAFAHSRLGNNEGTGECYLHALQAAKDTGDQHAQWQAMEGLGAVAFRDGNLDRAVKFYNQAIASFAASGEKNPMAHERLVTKLKDAMQTDILTNGGTYKHHKRSRSHRKKNEHSPAVYVTVNDGPRPSTAQQDLDAHQLRNIREENIKFKKIPTEFDLIALGLGVYDSDSDLSVKHRNKKKSGHRHRSNHQAPASRTDEVDLQRSSSLGSHDKHSALKKDVGQKQEEHEPLTRRSSSVPRRITKGGSTRRRGMNPLLKDETYDSEEEWKKNMTSSKLSTKGYHQRLKPPSTSGDSDSSDNLRIETRAERRYRSDTLKQIPIQKQRHRTSDSDSVLDSNIGDIHPVHQAIVHSAPSPHGSNSRGSRSMSKTPSLTSQEDTQSTLKESDSQDSDSMSGGDDTNQTLSKYEAKLRAQQQKEDGDSDSQTKVNPNHRSASTSSQGSDDVQQTLEDMDNISEDEGTGSESESASDDTDKRYGIPREMSIASSSDTPGVTSELWKCDSIPPTPPPIPPHGNKSQPLNGTYESPMNEDAEQMYRPGKNYFKMPLHQSSCESRQSNLERSQPLPFSHKGDSPKKLLKARLCEVKKWKDCERYGFNIRHNSDVSAEFIGRIDANSPASYSGLESQDRIIMVNGINIEGNTHDEVLQLIKASKDKVELLVVDEEAFAELYEKGIDLKMNEMECISCPDSRPSGQKISIPSAEDPLYMTIKSLQGTGRGTLQQNTPSTSADAEPPALPPPRVNGEQDQFLRNYEQMHAQNTRENNEHPTEDDEVTLPTKIQGKVKSKACIIM